MKTIKLLSITSLSILLLAGCGEESNKSVFGDANIDGVYTLSVGGRSEVLQGDILEPDSTDTIIEVEHIIDNDAKYVTIVSGSATLLRGAYAVQ